MRDKVSLTIGMPVYNAQATIKEGLDSVVSQITPKIQKVCDIEILICDNCSTDNTEKIIKAYIKNHSKINIRYHKNDSNIDAPKNIGVVFDNAHGDYVWLLGDDKHANGSILYSIQLIKKFDPHVIIHQASVYKDTFHQNNLLDSSISITHDQFLDSTHSFLHNPYITHRIFFISILILKKELWNKCNDKDYNLYYPHTSVLLKAVSQNIRVCVVAKPFIQCRYFKKINDDVAKYISYILKIMSKATKHFNKNKLDWYKFAEKLHCVLLDIVCNNCYSLLHILKLMYIAPFRMCTKLSVIKRHFF